MPRENGSSFELCIILLVMGGAVTIFYIPATAPIVLVILIPVVTISLYFRRMPRAESASQPAAQQVTAEAESSEEQPEETPTIPEATPSSAPTMTGRAAPPHVPLRPASSSGVTRSQAEKGPDSVELLQARIEELEERIRRLREQLATGLTDETAPPTEAELDAKPSQPITVEATEELSERALQQLLEALEEKRAKRAISQQLYQRLRDKYLARLSRARGKRETAPEVASSKPRRR